MKKILFTCVATFILVFRIVSQGNCLIYPETSGERTACELSYKAIEHPQGSIESQMLFDSAIAIGPQYAWAYYQKSVPYFKRGLLAEAVEMLNHAVELEPQDYLCYRAYWYYQHQSYRAVIRDLEAFYNLPNSYTSYNPGGDMDMRILLAMSYSNTSDYEKGIAIMEECLHENLSSNFLGAYDHYALGFLYYKNGDVDDAIAQLIQQIDNNVDFYDSYYYLALSYMEIGDIKNALYNMNEVLLRMNKEKAGYSRIDLGPGITKEDVIQKLELFNSL